MADTLRNKALSGYVYISFTSMNHGHQEIAVSYWPNIEAVSHWKNDDLHLQALQMGREKWYKHFSVDITELLKSYEHTSPSN
jgi:heme-degrading monooxygenase HmoA